MVSRLMLSGGRRWAEAPRDIRVSRVEVEEFVRDNVCVEKWLRKYSSGPEGGFSGSKLNGARILCRFFRWLRVHREIFLSAKEVLEKHRKLRLSAESELEDRQWLLNLVLDHSRDNEAFSDYGDQRKYEIFACMAFYLV